MFYPDYPELDQASSCISCSTSYMDITSESEQGKLSACDINSLRVNSLRVNINSLRVNSLRVNINSLRVNINSLRVNKIV